MSRMLCLNLGLAHADAHAVPLLKPRGVGWVAIDHTNARECARVAIVWQVPVVRRFIATISGTARANANIVRANIAHCDVVQVCVATCKAPSNTDMDMRASAVWAAPDEWAARQCVRAMQAAQKAEVGQGGPLALAVQKAQSVLSAWAVERVTAAWCALCQCFRLWRPYAAVQSALQSKLGLWVSDLFRRVRLMLQIWLVGMQPQPCRDVQQACTAQRNAEIQSVKPTSNRANQ